MTIDLDDFVTPEGLNAPTSSEFTEFMRDQYAQADDTPTDINWGAEAFLGNITAVSGVIFGYLADGVVGLWDSLNANNADGIYADNIAFIRGTSRRAATYSVVREALLTGDPGTIIEQGRIVQGGGIDGEARWITAETVTLDGGGTALVDLRAVNTGLINADVGTITTIISRVNGWDTITNPNAAVPGDDRESTSELLFRSAQAINQTGGAIGAVQAAAINATDAVEAVIVVENDSNIPQTIDGILVQANTLAIYLYDGTPTGALTDDQLDAIGRAWYMRGNAAGIRTQGNNTITVTARDLTDKEFKFSYATQRTVDTVMVIEIETGADFSSIEAQVKADVAAYFDTLTIGQTVSRLSIFGILARITGITKVTTLTLNGVADDFVPNRTEIAVSGLIAVGL